MSWPSEPSCSPISVARSSVYARYADCLDRADVRGFDLAEFLERPKCFLEPLPVGCNDGGQIRTYKLGAPGDRRADVGLVLARCEQVTGSHGPQCPLQVVAQTLQLGGQEPVVEHHAHIIFDDGGKPSRSAIGRGVQHAQQRHGTGLSMLVAFATSRRCPCAGCCCSSGGPGCGGMADDRDSSVAPSAVPGGARGVSSAGSIGKGPGSCP